MSQPSPTMSPNFGNSDNPTLRKRPPKISKAAQVPVWPKRKYPEITKAQVTKKRNEYKQKWSEPPEKPPKGTAMPYKLQVLWWFFGNQISEKRREEGDEQPVARCYTCKSHGTKMPSAEDAPDGTEVRQCAPCGCDFAAACLEYYYVKLGLYDRAKQQMAELHPQRTLVPKAFGQNAYQMLLCWEIEHGEWSIEKMIDLHKEKSSALEAISTTRIDNNEVLGATAKKPSALRRKKSKKDVNSTE
ncbi:uncharacterized protein BDR25DRAFT_301583 [Lindgomyces ingoldianus]|uniref:Uncharacterized protein n=1 Tax=Lindgomyces ingoldianus TaxID=673940 RepID=A0ACB6R706_9PLEO|nr:uncharacterized protein BDR25DRAFT_301583 [Lindgomyces ingoldianus]KAF2474097.1 hypothetical protein BDR25DRAFT_301583 [Lindgomyces ingoldianus]